MAGGPARAVDAVRSTAADLVRHAAWYVRYRMHGHTRDAPPREGRKPAPARPDDR
jgi:hypothetical protein